MIDRRTLLATTSLGLLGLLGACAGMSKADGWVTLVDGSRIPEGWTQLGQGNWSVVDGALQGTAGKLGYLVSPASYTDFEIRAEFWADADCNSGIFIRCADRNKVGADSAYEVNIFDKRPDPSYGTAAIVDIAKVRQPGPMAANRWNTFEISAKGERMTVVFNGEKTVDTSHPRLKSGPIALQSAGGVIRWRKVQIRPV